MLVYSTAAYEYYAVRLVNALQAESGLIDRRAFPDGETYHRLETDPWNRDVLLVGGASADADVLELFDLGCALADGGARSLTLVVPYMGYMTMDRANLPGEVVKAKTRARLLSAIPRAALHNELLLLEIHSEGLPYYFEGPRRVTPLTPRALIADTARELGGDDFVLASADAGRAKWVIAFAKEIGVRPAFVQKQRLDGAHTAIIDVSGDVEGRNVVIYDDMIRTGGTLIQAAEAYLARGARQVAAVVTHVLCDAATRDRLAANGALRCIVGADTTPRALELQNDFLRLNYTADTFSAYLLERGAA